MEQAFPERFGNAKNMEMIQATKQKAEAILRRIATGDASWNDKEDEANRKIAHLMKPKDMDGDSKKNAILVSRKEFEESIAAMMTRGIEKPDKLSIMRFYSSIEVFEKQLKAQRDGIERSRSRSR